MQNFLQFFAGIIVMGYLTAGVFFLKFWSRTRDGLFLVFAAAFWLLAANTTISTILDLPRENAAIVYLLRLAAFSLIIAAIIWKNVGSGARSGR